MNRIAHWLKVLRGQENKRRFLTSRFLYHSGLGRFCRIQRRGYMLRYYRSNLSQMLWLEPTAREWEERFLERYLRLGDVLVDVGANIGLMTLKGSAIVGELGKVAAFEPHPRVFAFLKGNIRLNGFSNIGTYHVALGTESGKSIGFSSSKYDDMNQVSTLDVGIEVPVARLDDYAAEIAGEVALLKVDVEGYEKFVFEGGREILGRTKCILFEACEEHAAKFCYGVPEIFELLGDLGFTIYRWKEEDVVTKVASDDPIKSMEDLLAVRDVDDLLDRTGYRLG